MRTVTGRVAGGLLGVLGLVWGTLSVWGATVPAPSAEPAYSRTVGVQAFQHGDFAQAIAHWQATVQAYATAQQPQAQSVALRHLAQAYEAVGHYQEARQHLQTALQLADATADRAQQALILGSLGSIAAALGESATAEQLLGEALGLAHDLGEAGVSAAVLSHRGALFLGQKQFPEALAAYRESAALAQQAEQPGMVARALLHAALAAEQARQPQVAQSLVAEALAVLPQVESSHDKAYELLLAGQIVWRLAAAIPALTLRAAALFQEAAQLAQALADARALSYAWGYLGRLYEEAQRYTEALQLTRQAVQAAQQVHAPESLVQWQWQTGRVLRALGDVPQALAAYERAVALVQTRRTEILRGHGRLTAPFRRTWGPLYFELVDMLLQQAAALETSATGVIYPHYAWYVHQARLVVEQFKSAELRDYFGDPCVDAVRPQRTALEQVAPDTMVLYPILLPDRTELLVSLSTGLKRVAVPVPGAMLEQRITHLRHGLAALDRQRYTLAAQDLYNWLIRPLAAELLASQVRTLVFVPDGALRLLPLAVLHDGQQFLIERYALAVTPSLALTEPWPLRQETIQALAAGLATAMENFPPLPRVVEELQSVAQLYGGTVLLDQAFVPERLERALTQGQFGIVHIASHGHFAAEAAQSFLLTAQGKLTMERLAQIVGRLRWRDQPLELLTLSACETAQGDDRAALGLAGVAIQAGARSAVATLWVVADEAAAKLMRLFYQGLHTPGTSRARALQQAQIALLKEPQYADPFFWAPFLLINNWL